LGKCYFTSCIKEESTFYKASVLNKTSHNVVILPFKSGLVLSSDTLKLSPNNQLQIAQGSFRGLNDQPGFISGYFGGTDDSLVIIFDGFYKVTHYANTPA